MPMRSLALALGLAFATPALAVEMTITVEGEANGAITIDLLEEVAPNHVAQIRTWLSKVPTTTWCSTA